MKITKDIHDNIFVSLAWAAGWGFFFGFIGGLRNISTLPNALVHPFDWYVFIVALVGVPAVTAVFLLAYYLTVPEE